MNDAGEVKEMLAQRAEEVCRYLFPTGQKIGKDWAIGDVHGADGKSLKICLEGNRAGWWCDFADGPEFRGRNLLQLWTKVRGDNFKQAIKEAKDFLGIKDNWQRQTAAPPQRIAKEVQKKEMDLTNEYIPLNYTHSGPVEHWLMQERRIPAEILTKYGVGKTKDDKYAAFPSFSAEGVLESIKFRHIEDKKKMFVKSNGKKLLFGIQAVDPKDGVLFVTEGEIDALTLAAYNQPAVSVPFGAKWPNADGQDPNDEWILHDFDWLEDFAEIFLALDVDEPGKRAMESLVPRFRRERCRLFIPPRGCKDPNECLLAGVPEDEIWSAVEEAQHYDPAELKRPSDYRAEVWEQFYPTSGKEPGEVPPWSMPFCFRPGEVTVWQGYTAHGKTVGLTYCLCHFASMGVKSCDASMEIPARRTIQNIIRQVLAKRKPCDENELDEALKWLDDRFWIYDCLGEATTKSLLECFSYASRKYGVKHFVIDSLMKLDVDEEDNESQKEFLNKLCRFAVEHKAHVHIVAHSKKPDARHPEKKNWPTKYGVRGSAHIVDLAHNVVCMWRNKQKEEEVRAAYETREGDNLDSELAELEKVNDALFIVQKQRGGDGDEPVKRLWFDQHESWHYRQEQERNDLPHVFMRGPLGVEVYEYEKKKTPQQDRLPFNAERAPELRD